MGAFTFLAGNGVKRVSLNLSWFLPLVLPQAKVSLTTFTVGMLITNSPISSISPCEYLFGEITRAVMESLASENGARLRVMETADHNIADKLDKFRLKEHTLRQEAITSELLDVVTGSEAILARPGR